MTEDRRQRTRRSPNRAGGRRATDRQPEWLSVTLYAEKYGVDRNTVYKWLKAGLLVSYRVESLVRIRNLQPNQHRALLKAAPESTGAESGIEPL